MNDDNDDKVSNFNCRKLKYSEGVCDEKLGKSFKLE